MGGGSKIIKGLQDAIDGNFTRVEMGSQAWIRVDHTTRPAGNASAWALGFLNKHGRFHIRRIVWGRAAARVEKRLDEIIRPALVLVKQHAP